MNKCSTCVNWLPHPHVFIKHLGACHSDKMTNGFVDEHITDALVYEYDESGGFFTGPDFGCVHWSEKNKS